MADLVEELTCHLAEKFCGGLKIEHKDEDGNVTRTIDLARPWKRESYHTLIAAAAGEDFFSITAAERRSRCESLGVQISEAMEDHEVIQQVFEKLVEEKTFDPCFVTRVSSELVPLAKITPGGKTVEVYELIINGQEISPGYSELNDPDVQRQRLEEQSGEETQRVDYDFIETLEHGMPPAGGIGIGLDRLCMMLTGAPTIRDVVLFPLLKRKD
jgi:lysyl-tRNA synthetase class 2